MTTVRIVAWALFGIWCVLFGGFEIRMLRRHLRGVALGRAGGFKYIPMVLAAQLGFGLAATVQGGLLLTAVFLASVLSPLWTVSKVIAAGWAVRRRRRRGPAPG